MLWAQFQPKNDAEAVGFAIGIAFAGLICGGIPFVTGLILRQPTLAVVGGVISAVAGALIGCCLAMPVSLIFTIVIVLMAQTANARAVPSPFHRPMSEDYDDYARPFQIPGRQPDPREIPYAEDVDQKGPGRGRAEPDRRREADDDWRRRAEEEGWRPPRGPRPPRRPDKDPDAW